MLGLKVGMIDHLRRNGKLACEKNQFTGAVRYVYADILALKVKREAPGRIVTGPQNLPTQRAADEHRTVAQSRG